MSRSTKLGVMISSKCETKFPTGTGRKLSDIRKDLKKEIEEIIIGGSQLFEVWINEETPPKGGKWDSWDVCMQAAKDSDIMIVITNGEAGWASNRGDVGVCHAEMMTALSSAPAKVRLIALQNVSITDDDEGQRNKRFQDELESQSLFRGGEVTEESMLKSRVFEALSDAVVCLVQAGSADAARGKYHSGGALDWSRLDFRSRRDEMVKVVRTALRERISAREENGRVFVKLQGVDVLVEVHALPAAFTIGPARELVGQPFLRDHELSSYLNDGVGGPLHVIACHRSATENQAVKLLGFPDATIVSTPFGIFVADPVQNVQFAFITNCRDESNTRHGVQRFFDWLGQTKEEVNVVQRALSRAEIVRVVAKVQSPKHESTPVSSSKRNTRTAKPERRK